MYKINRIVDPYSFIKTARHCGSIVYFLYDGDELVYVGKTGRGLARVYEHTKKVFTHVSFQYCDDEYLDELEQAYIAIYKPKYNIVVPTKKHSWVYAAMTYSDYHKLDPSDDLIPNSKGDSSKLFKKYKRHAKREKIMRRIAMMKDQQI